MENERKIQIAGDKRMADALAKSDAAEARNRTLLDRIASARGGSKDRPVADVFREAVEGLRKIDGSSANITGAGK